MRIISDYHDYYDCMKDYDLEDEPLYLRKTEIIKSSSLHNEKAVNLILIGNKILPVKRMAFQSVSTFGTHAIHVQYCYNLEQVDKFVEMWYDKKEKSYYYETKKKRIWSYIDQYYGTRRKDYKAFFDRDYSCYLNLLEEYKSPVLAISAYDRGGYYYIIKNPNLKNYHAQRALSPPLAYQEIRMWLSNQAAPEKPIPELSNKDKIVSKGFDGSSFRNTK